MPAPPSVVALPPRPIYSVFAPAATAASMSSPTPRVVAARAASVSYTHLIGLVEKLVIVLATRGNQIELEDEETEDEEPGDDRHGTDGNRHEPLRQLGGKGDETGNGLDEAREKRAEARGEQDALEQAVEGGVDHEQDRRRPEVHELEGLGDAREDGDERRGNEHGTHLGTMLGLGNRDEGEDRTDGAEPLARCV